MNNGSKHSSPLIDLKRVLHGGTSMLASGLQNQIKKKRWNCFTEWRKMMQGI